MSDLVGYLEDQFSHVTAHIYKDFMLPNTVYSAAVFSIPFVLFTFLVNQRQGVDGVMFAEKIRKSCHDCLHSYT